MRKLKHVKYVRANELTEESKDELMIPKNYHGMVAMETWEVNGKLSVKGVCVLSVVDYIIGLGDTKDVKIEE